MWVTPALMGARFHWLFVLNLAVTTLGIMFDYVYALIFRKGSFTERIAQGEKDSETSVTAWDGPRKTFGAATVGSVLLLYIAILIAWAIGTIHARFQEGYVVLKATPEFAVIKRYGDRVIAIRYEGSPPTATGEFRVLELEKDMEFINVDKLSIESVRRRRADSS